MTSLLRLARYINPLCFLDHTIYNRAQHCFVSCWSEKITQNTIGLDYADPTFSYRFSSCDAQSGWVVGVHDRPIIQRSTTTCPVLLPSQHHHQFSWACRRRRLYRSRQVGLAGRPKTRHGFSPVRHVVNRARAGLVRSPGRAWAEGVAQQARPGTARF
jgi:hypothetical protein